MRRSVIVLLVFIAAMALAMPAHADEITIISGATELQGALVAMQTNDLPLVAYVTTDSNGSSGIWLVDCPNAACTGATPREVTTGTRILFGEMVIDSNNRPIIFYYELSQFFGGTSFAKLLICDSPTCNSPITRTIQEAGTNEGNYYSLELLLVNDLPVVGYQVNIVSNQTYRVEFCQEVTCATRTSITQALPSDTATIDFALDIRTSNGLPVISHYQQGGSEDRLRTARCNTTQCNNPTVFTIAGVTGYFLDMHLTAGDAPVILFNDDTGTDANPVGTYLYTCPGQACNEGNIIKTTLNSDDASYMGFVFDSSANPSIFYTLDDTDLVVELCFDAICTRRYTTSSIASAAVASGPAISESGSIYVTYTDVQNASNVSIVLTRITPDFDVNDDDAVTPADALYVINRFGGHVPGNEAADVNFDGVIDAADAEAVIANIGRRTGTGD